MVTSGLFLYGASAVCAEISQQHLSDREVADDWMRKWMISDASPRGPDGALYMGRFADPTYFTLSPIGWTPEGAQVSRYETVRVPSGFVTDFASIPRIFWSLLPPDGLYAYAAIIHDYLYWEQSVPRDKADEILKMCMEDFRIDSVTIAAIFGGVRLGGATAWDDNTKLKARGERRQLKLVPKDPIIRWAEWKLKPEVF